MSIIIYGIKNCDTMKKARAWLDDHGVAYEFHDYKTAGIGKDKLKETAKWGRKISAYFELHKKFPEGKKNAAQVKVALVLNRRGNVISANVVESSGDQAYDAAALAMIHRSDPVPAPPADLTEDQFAFSLPVIFNARK